MRKGVCRDLIDSLIQQINGQTFLTSPLQFVVDAVNHFMVVEQPLNHLPHFFLVSLQLKDQLFVGARRFNNFFHHPANFTKLVIADFKGIHRFANIALSTTRRVVFAKIPEKKLAPAGGFVGGITNNNEKERSFEVSLDFLNAGKSYQMTSFEDGINAGRQAMDYRKNEYTITKDEKIKLKMVRNGGWAAVIE